MQHRLSGVCWFGNYSPVVAKYNERIKFEVEEMLLFIDPEKCVGCLACVMACSLQHGSTVGFADSRILPVMLKGPVINIPVVCRQCAKPLCADVCPMGALSRDEKSGAMVVDPDLCIGCGMCMTACPLGGMSLNNAGEAVKCDLCGGDPLCAKFCAYGAIEYITREEAALRRKKGAVDKLATMLEKIVFS